MAIIKPKQYGDLPATASVASSGKSQSGRDFGGKVNEQYFGMHMSDGQSADEPWDPKSKGDKATDGVFKTGRGAQGGGSKMTPQIKLMTAGSGTRRSRVHVGSTYPKNTQKLRG